MFAGNLGLSPSISSHFTPLQPKIAKKSPKTPILGFSQINIDHPKKLVALVLVMLSSMSVPICNHFHVR